MRDLIKWKTSKHNWYLRNKEITSNRSKKRRINKVKESSLLINTIKYTYGCKICKEDDPKCLDFHHIKPSNKTRNISLLVKRGHGLNKIITEISKCVILCANCHLIAENNNPPTQNIPKYNNLYVFKRRLRNKNFTNKLKDKCKKCSMTNKICLQFHHIKDKKYDISFMVIQGYSIKTIQNEIKKCIILCGNCHRKIGRPI